MQLRFTQSARRHRIGREHVRFMLASADRVFSVDDEGHVFTWYFGADERGVELEVMGRVAVDPKLGERVFLVMHVMPSDFRDRKGVSRNGQDG